MSDKSETDETDVEMGNKKSTMELCFDCIDEKDIERDDTSQQTLDEKSRSCDEDDLGDNEDEYKQELFNSYDNGNNDDEYDGAADVGLYGKNDTCFDMNANFLNILDKNDVDTNDIGISMPSKPYKDSGSFDAIIKG